MDIAIKIVNLIKSRPLQARLFARLCEEMGSNHESLILHTEIRWLSRGKVLTRLVELREEVAIFIDDQNELVKSLRDLNFVLKLTYLADIFIKLNELNLYLQGMGDTNIFAVHDKIRGFIKKLILWRNNIEDHKYESFETFETFIIENNVNVSNSIITEISKHLNTLEEKFNYYFTEEMENCKNKKWVMCPFRGYTTTGISLKADEELIDLSENTLLKLNFNANKLIQFWLSIQQTFPILSAEALKVLLPFTSSYLCEIGFSAMVGIKTKYRNKLQLSNSLRLKITGIDMDFNSIINTNQKQAHPSHKPC